MKNLKKLSRENLKDLKGGGEQPNVISADEGCTYKCCWDNQPGNCSETITAAPGQPVSCVEGAKLILVNG